MRILSISALEVNSWPAGLHFLMFISSFMLSLSLSLSLSRSLSLSLSPSNPSGYQLGLKAAAVCVQ